MLVGLLLGLLTLTGYQPPREIFIAGNGYVSFLSDAPMEMISASSESLKGALDIEERTFSFVVPVNTFEGFNSLLQQTHFNDDYLETDLYPQASFKGKIIEEIDLSKPGEHSIRAKGKMNIHGVDFDRIIRCDVRIAGESISVRARFTVFLDEHGIKIPSIVNQKISEEIQVEIKLELLAQS